MVLPIELSHLDRTIVHLLFESLTEQEIMPELGAYDLAIVRHHLIALIELGYIQGEIVPIGSDRRTAHARCLTIKGYALLAGMNSGRERSPGTAPFFHPGARGWAFAA